MKLGRRGPPSERLRQVFSIVSMYIIYLYFNCSFEQRVSLGFSGHSSGRGPVARDHVRCKHFGFRSREICKKMCVCLLKNGLKVWCTSRGKPARWALRARGPVTHHLPPLRRLRSTGLDGDFVGGFACPFDRCCFIIGSSACLLISSSGSPVCCLGRGSSGDLPGRCLGRDFGRGSEPPLPPLPMTAARASARDIVGCSEPLPRPRPRPRPLPRPRSPPGSPPGSPPRSPPRPLPRPPLSPPAPPALTRATASGLDSGDCFGCSASIHSSERAGSAGQCFARMACQAKPAGVAASCNGVAASCNGDGFCCSSSGGDFDRGFDRSPELPWPPRSPLTAATACGRERGDCFRACLGRSSFGGDFERDFDRNPELPRPRRPLLTTTLVSGLDLGDSVRDRGDCSGHSSSLRVLTGA